MKNSVKIDRTIKGLTQEELAKMINVSRQTVSSIEKGKYTPSTILALKLSQIFEKSVNEIFELEDID